MSGNFKDAREKSWKMGNVRELSETSGYTAMVHGRGCNPHRSTTTFANLEIASL